MGDKRKMIEEEMKKLKQTVDYFGHWYDVIGEERVAILEKAVKELEKTNELQGELENWKSEWQEQVQKATDEGYARTLQTIQLTKAKEIIKDLLLMAKVEHLKERYESVDEAEQFLKDSFESEAQEEPYYVIMNMNCQYEICRKCPKSGLFKGTYEECEDWIKTKESEV